MGWGREEEGGPAHGFAWQTGFSDRGIVPRGPSQSPGCHFAKLIAHVYERNERRCSSIVPYPTSKIISSTTGTVFACETSLSRVTSASYRVNIFVRFSISYFSFVGQRIFFFF